MDQADAEPLVLRVLAGEVDAWSRLWKLIEAKLLATFRRSHFLGRLSQSEDDCRTIVVNVMARLQADDFARLRAWHHARAHGDGPPFVAWLLVVAKRVAVDHMRAHDEYIDRRHEAGASRPGAWRVLDTLIADSRAPGARPHVTDEGTAHEILARAADLPAPQKDALGAWLAGRSYEEIAVAHGLADPRAAERAVRAALQRLRREFRDEDLG